MQKLNLQMLDNCSKDVIKHITHMNMLDVFQYSYKKYGVTINDVVSMGYSHRGHTLYNSTNESNMNKYKSHLDYNTQQALQNLYEMYSCIQNYRSKLKKNSLLNVDQYKKQFDVIEKSIDHSKAYAQDWWSKNHQRTLILIKCDESSKLTATDESEQNRHPYDRRKLSISPLWFHKVFKKGLSGVEYKGRPHFIADLKQIPIHRLDEQGMKAYKVDVVGSKGGVISIIKDLYCVAFETEPYQKIGSVHNPSKVIASISPELRLAEVNVSKRITKNVIDNLLD